MCMYACMNVYVCVYMQLILLCFVNVHYEEDLYHLPDPFIALHTFLLWGFLREIMILGRKYTGPLQKKIQFFWQIVLYTP